MAPSVVDLFARDYEHARMLFLEAARARSSSLEHIDHDTVRGPGGGAIGVDIAAVGAASARNLAFVVSATHGVEGYLGSAAQCGVLRDEMCRTLPEGVGLVLVHAINPHGFSYDRRVDDENIDINRNFIAHGAGAPSASEYGLLHAAVMTWDGATRLQDEPEIARFIRERGASAFQAALTSGQRTHPDGLFFAGRHACWSNRIWRRILRTYAARASRLFVVDLHTGLGERGACELILMTGDPRQASRAFGKTLTPLAAGDTSASGSIAGTLLGATRQETSAEVTGVAMEIGTVPLLEMLDVLRAEHWVRYHEAPEPLALAVRRRMRTTFYPQDDAWKRSAWSHLRENIARAIAALAN